MIGSMIRDVDRGSEENGHFVTVSGQGNIFLLADSCFQKHKTQLDTVDELLKDLTLTTFTQQKWEFVWDILCNLGKDGQSSEDTD